MLPITSDHAFHKHLNDRLLEEMQKQTALLERIANAVAPIKVETETEQEVQTDDHGDSKTASDTDSNTSSRKRNVDKSKQDRHINLQDAKRAYVDGPNGDSDNPTK